MRSVMSLWVCSAALLIAPLANAAERAGAVELSPPAGWTKSQRSNMVLFSAPGLPAGDFAHLVVLPHQTAGQWPSSFEALWSEIKAEHRDIQETPSSAGERNGSAFRVVAGSMADAKGQFLYITLFAARRGGLMQPLLFVSNRAALYEQQAGPIEETLESVKFITDKPGAPPKRPTIAALVQSRPASTTPAAPQAAAQPVAPQSPGGTGGNTVSLIGTWSSGSVSPVGFYDASTGSWAPPSGVGQSYELRDDGTFTYAGLIQSSMLSCTTRVFIYSTGVWRKDGSTLVFREKTSRTRSTDNCNKKFNYEKSPPTKTEKLPFRVEQDSAGVSLVLTVKEGELQLYRR